MEARPWSEEGNKNRLVVNDGVQESNLAGPARKRTSSLEKLYDLLEATLGDEGTGNFLDYAITRRHDPTKPAAIEAPTPSTDEIDNEDRMR